MTDSVTHQSGCLLCGSALSYNTGMIPMTCVWCGVEQLSDARCENGHFICSACHASPGRDLISRVCLETAETDPLVLADRLMHAPGMHLHGPEHHFLVPAVLLTAVANQTGQQKALTGWIEKANKRSLLVPGGFCGLTGTCGAAVGTGMALSILTDNTPLSETTWGLCQELTAASLTSIASKGGPRCCKRDTFLAIQSAVRFLNDRLDYSLPESEMTCSFSSKNKECLKGRCPFFPAGALTMPESGVF